MTVKQLIEILSKYDENATISFWTLDSDNDYYKIDDNPIQDDNRLEFLL